MSLFHIFLIHLAYIASIEGLTVTNPFSNATSNSSRSSCQLNKYCDYEDYGLIRCENYTSQSDINPANCALGYQPFDSILRLQFVMSSRQVLDSGLLEIIRISEMINTQEGSSYVYDFGFRISFYRLGGIDFDFFAPIKTQTLNTFSHPTNLEISDSDIKFYYKKEDLMTPEKCNPQAYNVVLNSQGENMFNSFVDMSFSAVKYPVKICKYLFQGIRFLSFRMTGFAYEFYEDKIDSSHASSLLNSSIEAYFIRWGDRLNLNSRFLHPEVFRRLQTLDIEQSNVRSIQTDLFSNRFHELKTIRLQITNLKGLFHDTGGVAWVKYLKLHNDPVNLDHVFVVNEQFMQRCVFIWVSVKANSPQMYPIKLFPYMEYLFPNDDFCLYYDLPFERLVFLMPDNPIAVSCTVAWLLKYRHLFRSYLAPLSDSFRSNLSALDCNFTSMQQVCELDHVKQTLYQTDPYFFTYSMSKSLGELEIILLTYIGPVVSCFGLITNLIVALTILYNHKRRREIRAEPKSKKKEMILLDEPLYKYILLNSILNFLYTFMFFLNYTIPCHPRHAGLSFSSSTCLVKNQALDFIGSVLKLMSNFSILQTSLNRYLLVGKDHSDHLIKISKIKVKKFFAITILVSVLLSIVIIFQRKFFIMSYRGSDSYYYEENYYHSYYWSLGNKNVTYTTFIQKMNQLSVLTGFTLLHDAFSYFLFCLVSLIMDTLTIKKLKDALREKEKIKGDQEREKNRDSEKRSIIMVLLSSLVNFLFRAPELASIVMFYTITDSGGYMFKSLCWTYASCLVAVDISNVFYIMSLCFYLFFYLKFNSVFKNSFDKLHEKFYSCLKISKRDIK